MNIYIYIFIHNPRYPALSNEYIYIYIHTHTHINTDIYIFDIYIYILSSTDRLFRYITTLQYG